MTLSLTCLLLAAQAGPPGLDVPTPCPGPVPPPTAAASTPPVDLCYRFDDRITDFTIGFASTSADYLNLLAFQAPHGGDTITTLEVQNFGGYASNPYSSSPITWAIYEDPTDDFDPSDAVLVWTQTDVSSPQSANNGIFQSVAVPNVPVSGTWWAAVLYEGVQPGEYPSGFSTEVPSFGRSWEVSSTVGSFDMTTLTNNGYISNIESGCCDGVWHIRAEGTQCVDTSECYAYDSGVVDLAFGLECGTSTNPFPMDTLMLNAYESEGVSDQLLELSAHFGHPTLGSAGYDPNAAIDWAIWDDPTNDGDPIDAVLLWTMPDTVGTDLDSGGFKTVAVPEIPVSGTFFVGVRFTQQANVGGGNPMSLDTSVPSGGNSWLGHQLSGVCSDAIDLADLGSVSSLHRTTTMTSYWNTHGAWMLRARGWLCDCGDPVRYCESAPNSVSTNGARIFTQGSISITANDLVVSAVNCPPMQSALLVSGADKLFHPLGDGYLCVYGNPVHRVALLTTDANGQVDYALDQNALPLGYSVVPGQTWNFQYWYRDTVGSGANLSNAVAVTFCP